MSSSSLFCLNDDDSQSDLQKWHVDLKWIFNLDNDQLFETWVTKISDYLMDIQFAKTLYCVWYSHTSLTHLLINYKRYNNGIQDPHLMLLEINWLELKTLALQPQHDFCACSYHCNLFHSLVCFYAFNGRTSDLTTVQKQVQAIHVHYYALDSVTKLHMHY